MTELDDTIQLHTPIGAPSVSFHCLNDEMLKITQDAFYVRGQPVPIDAQEANTVYEAFRAWLTWTNMQRR